MTLLNNYIFFNFNSNIYGREVTVQFIQKIRDEKIFPSPAQLIAQLQSDEIRARKILK